VITRTAISMLIAGAELPAFKELGIVKDLLKKLAIEENEEKNAYSLASGLSVV
jgi:hypothetical protein